MTSLAETFHALGNPTRFAIVERLMREGELSAGDLLDGEQVSAPALSRHVKLLREAGLINGRVDKQRRLYSLRPEGLKAIQEWTLEFPSFWEGSMDRLAEAIKRARKEAE